MKKRRFIQCDVFSGHATKGNGLAVVVDGDDLSDTQMQGFAAWTNLAETTFLLAPTDARADYKVRIFSPNREMRFAGHPTLGSCAAWLHVGNVPNNKTVVRQECAVGIIDIDISGPIPAFIAPPTKIRPMTYDEAKHITKALGLKEYAVMRAVRLENGPVWHLLELSDAKAVLAVDSARVSWPEFQGVSVIGGYRRGRECDYEVRNLSPSSGMSEDPITGSLNAAIGHWLLRENRLDKEITIAQGTNINREGRVFIQPIKSDPAGVSIGGQTQVLIEGTVLL